MANETNAKRQSDFRKRMIADGFVQVTGWVHSTQSAEAGLLLSRLRTDRDLTVGPLRNTRTGKLEKLDRKPSWAQGWNA